MADNNNRKSNRNFRLEKPVERRFDIEKEVETVPVAPAAPVKPTQLKPGTGARQKPEAVHQKPASEPQRKDVPPTTPNSGNNAGDSGNKPMKWIVIALIIAAIATCAYFLMNGNKSDEGTDPQTPQVEQNDSTQNGNNAADSITLSQNEKEEDIADTVYEAAGESEQNTQDESYNSNVSASQPATSANDNQTAEKPSATQGTSSTQSSNSASDSSVEQKAKDVWKGVYGNNPDRRKNLGADYEAVQKLVNEMHRDNLN